APARNSGSTRPQPSPTAPGSRRVGPCSPPSLSSIRRRWSVTDSRIIFADCTLRDGEQAPGVFFTLEEKLRIAAMLDATGVDLIDAGMPSVSQEERDTLIALVTQNFRARVAATVRALRSDIDLAIECGVKEVFLFMPVSPQHLQHKFGIDL